MKRCDGRNQAGLGLAELLVSVAIGAMLVLTGAVMLFSANNAYTAQLIAAGLDDGGQLALDSIARAVHQAGFIDWEGDSAPDAANAALQILGRDAASIPHATHGIDGASADAVNGSDVLVLRFSGAHGGGVDCAGFNIGPGEEGWSIFHVGRNAAGEGELRCKYRGGSGWGSDAVVDGVDSFQVLYGIDTDMSPDGVPNEFVSASVIQARDATLVPTGVDAPARQRDLQRRSYWKRVVAVRIAVLLHSPGPAPRQGNAVFDLFGPGYSARFGATDNGVHIEEAAMPTILQARERRLVASTILLRNGAGAPP